MVCFPAFAQDGPVVEIDRIVITARVPEDDDLVKPETTVRLKASRPKTESVADVISRTAGVNVRRFGGLEAASSISIRGSSGEQVSLFLDGVPLETAAGEGINLGQITPASLSKIEIFKSFGPGELGAGAVGGIIHLKSREVEPGSHHRYGFGFGSFLTLDALAEFMRGGKYHDIIVGVDFRRTKGNFTFLDNNGTPLNPADDRRVERANNEYQGIHPYFKWRYQIDKRSQFTWVHHVFHTDSGVPGLGSFQSKNADLKKSEWLSSFQFTWERLFGGRTTFKNNLYWRWIHSRFSDPFGEIGLGAKQDTDNNTVIIGNRLFLNTEFGRHVTVRKGVEFIHEQFFPKDLAAANSVGSTSKRQQLNMTLEPHVFFFEKKLRLVVQAQSLNAFYNVNNNDPALANAGTFFSNRTQNQFAGTVLIDYSPFADFHLKASGGRAVRLPKFVEMFGDQGNIVGNPALVSEESVKFDAGVLWQKRWRKRFFQKLGVEFNYFESHVDDLIQFEVASGFARASNIGKARVRGVEFVVGAAFADYFELSANYTWQDARDRSVRVGNFLVGRPEHELNAALTFQKANFSAGADLNFVDNQYLDALNTQRVENRLIVNLEAAYLIKDKYRLGVEAKNITDSQVVDAVGFPLPGRSFFGRVDVFF